MYPLLCGYGLVIFIRTKRLATPLPAGTLILICWVPPLSLSTVGALTPEVLQSPPKVSLHSTVHVTSVAVLFLV